MNIQVAEVTDKSVTLTWDAPQSDGGSPITGYVVEKRQSHSPRWVKASKTPVIDRTFTLPDLIENNDYEFRVSAENQAGIGSPSEPTPSVKVKFPFGKIVSFMHVDLKRSP